MGGARKGLVAVFAEPRQRVQVPVFCDECELFQVIEVAFG